MKKIVIICLLSTLALGISAVENPSISFLIRGADTNARSGAENPIIAELDKQANATLTFEWMLDPDFSDRIALGIATDKLPMVVAMDKNALFLKAVREGRFWDIGPYIHDYPNLAKINPLILENTKVDGILYALPKTRPLGRNAFVYRQDWLETVGMTAITTIDDFQAVLEAFTLQDPDKNEKNDTYGMVLTSYRGSFEEIAVWFGAPNAWGLQGEQLLPSFLFPGYRESLHFLRDAYKNGFINRNFAAQDPAEWNKLLAEGRAGIIVDITGRGPGVVSAAKNLGRTVEMNIQGAVEGPEGYRVMATDGFAGIIAITKSGVKDEATLRSVLAYLDLMNSDKGRDLLLLGFEGIDWTRNPSGGVSRLNYEGKITAGPDIAQAMVFASSPSATVVTPSDSSGRLRTETEVQTDNELHLVPNLAVGLTSPTQSRRGGYLQDLMDDGRIRFVMGLIDDAAYDKLIERWRVEGGDSMIKEYNESYRRSQNLK